MNTQTGEGLWGSNEGRGVGLQADEETTTLTSNKDEKRKDGYSNS